MGQGHALPDPGHDIGGFAPGGRKAGCPADGHRIGRWRWPEAAAAASHDRRRGRCFDARKANGPLDRCPPTHRTRGARQPGLQYGLIAERHVAIDVLFGIVGHSRRQRGPGPVARAGRNETVTAVLVAVAVPVPATRVPGLAREHHRDAGGSPRNRHTDFAHALCSTLHT